MWGYGYGTPAAGMTAWMIISSVLWLLIVGVGVWAFVRWLGTRGPASSHPAAPTTEPTTASPSALEILRQRYARGEIDEATFQRMREQLAAASPDRPQEAALPNGRHPG